MKESCSTYLDGSFELEKDGLRDEDLTSLGAEVTNLSFEELDLLSRPASAYLKEAVDYRVEIDFVLVCHFESSPAAKRGHTDYGMQLGLLCKIKRVARIISKSKAVAGVKG